jgi:formylglycine-generating enzyme required for sulfatase activity
MSSKSKIEGVVCFIFVASCCLLSAADPVVSNVRAIQRPGTQLVDITYDQAVPVAPTGMALIPAGSFTMGYNLDYSWALPLRTVQVSGFYMDKYEVTKALWDSVYVWGVAHGYSFDNAGLGKASNHPVHTINWYDMVKWCNARSEKEGRSPAYYTSASLTTVYRTGQVGVQNDWVKWNAGYRLPTEAEWEKAARGGASGHRFPWSNVDTITHSQANYNSYSGYAYDTSPTRGYHPTYDNDPQPFTSPVGAFAPNGYGLYDMAGNVWEWCWEWFGSYSSGSQTNPHGPSGPNPEWGSNRVIRGGSWRNLAYDCRVARRYSSWPDYVCDDVGFRSAVPSGQR